eukprot:2202206-Alexandrium_andersonii.AAC.1
MPMQLIVPPRIAAAPPLYVERAAAKAEARRDHQTAWLRSSAGSQAASRCKLLSMTAGPGS